MRYFVIAAQDGRTIPLHAPEETMKFFDPESAALMLGFLNRLGHALEEFAISERSGYQKRRTA